MNLRVLFKVIEAWKQQFPNIKSPTAKNILLQVLKFKTHDSIAGLPRTQSPLIAKELLYMPKEAM